MKASIALGVRKSVLEDLVFTKSNFLAFVKSNFLNFAKFGFLDLVKFDFFDVVNFAIVDSTNTNSNTSITWCILIFLIFFDLGAQIIIASYLEY